MHCISGVVVQRASQVAHRYQRGQLPGRQICYIPWANQGGVGQSSKREQRGQLRHVLYLGKAQCQAQLHIRRFARGRLVRRPAVLVAVHEEQARRAGVLPSGSEATEQQRAIAADHQGEAIGGQRREHQLPHPLDNGDQPTGINQPGGGVAGSHEGRQRHITKVEHIVCRLQSTDQASLAQD